MGRISRHKLGIAMPAFAVALALSACASDAPSDTTATTDDAPLAELVPERIAAKDSIAVASSLGRVPLGFFADDNETIQGIDPELAAALGRLLGLEFEITDVRFPNIVPGIENGTYDLAMSGVQITPERATQVTMISYLNDAAVPLVRAGEEPAEGLCGSKAGAVAGAISVDYLEEYSDECTNNGEPEVQVDQFPDTGSVKLALESGRVDAAMLSESDANYVAGQSSEMLKTFGPALHELQYGIVVSNDNVEFAQAIKAALVELISDGTYGEILASWQNERMALDQPELIDPDAGS